MEIPHISLIIPLSKTINSIYII